MDFKTLHLPKTTHHRLKIGAAKRDMTMLNFIAYLVSLSENEDARQTLPRKPTGNTNQSNPNPGAIKCQQ